MRPFGSRWPAAFLADPVLGVIDAAGLLVGCLLFTRWSVGAAAAWLPAARGRSLRPALAIGQLIGALADGGALGVWLAIAPGYRSLVPAVLFYALFGPYTLVPILLATAFPLGAALRRPADPVRHALWLDTPDVAVLAAPRLRVGAVLVPALAVLGVAVAVDLLSRDGVRRLVEAVAAAHGWGSFGSVYTLLAMEIAPTIVIVPLVLAMTSGPASAGLGPAHAVLAAALSSFLALFVVIGVRQGVVCGAPCGGLRGGWEDFAQNLLLAEGFTLYLALALLTVICAVRGSLRRLVGTPRRWPADAVAADRTTRRPARPLCWSFALLVLVMSLTVSYGWARQTLLPATIQSSPVTEVDAAHPTRTSVPAGAVCSRDAALFKGITSPGEVQTQEVQLAVDAAASESPALSAFGASLKKGLRLGDPDRITARSLLAIQLYCARVTAR